jgi:ribonucleoside-diphosphate reductase alpha chain
MVDKLIEKPVEGLTFKVNTGCGRLYVTINKHKGPDKYQILLQAGAGRGCLTSSLDAVGKLSNVILDKGGELGDIVDALKGISCPSPHFVNNKLILSCYDAVAKVIEEYDKYV